MVCQQRRALAVSYGRSTGIEPSAHPDTQLKVLTLTQEGQLEDREPGKGNFPPRLATASYFSDGLRWLVARSGDLVFSQIDLWKGRVTIISPEYDGAMVTQEFPVYEAPPTSNGLSGR